MMKVKEQTAFNTYYRYGWVCLNLGKEGRKWETDSVDRWMDGLINIPHNILDQDRHFFFTVSNIKSSC